jgi:peptidoglycan/xylan/chitin deacetylase (PgdA/CDA1 family)
MALAEVRALRTAACCAAALSMPLSILAALASAQGIPTAASLRGVGTSGVDGLAAQAGAALAGAGVLEGSTPRRLIHFTFDDGPDRVHTPGLLDALERNGHKATFFFSTNRFEGVHPRHDYAPELARQVAARGHPIGSHGFDHVRMARMRPPAVRAQVDRSEALFVRVFGVRPHLFRPPFGSRNRALDARLRDGGYATVMWNIGLADWNQRPATEIANTFFHALRRNQQQRGDRGGIVLLHDTHAWGVEAYVLIAAGLAQRNCSLLKAREELYDVTDSLLPWAQPPSDEEHAARQAILRRRARQICAAAPPEP